MKRSMLLALAVVCVASLAFAQAGSIGVFTNCDAVDCNFVDFGALNTVYIVHVHTTGATASQFMLAPPPGWIHLGDTWYFPTVIGTSIAGVSVAYGACLTGPICLGAINFLGSNLPTATSFPCNWFGIVADPAAPSGLIEGVDCALPANKFYPTGGEGIVNGGGDCLCDTPVEDATWGGVKALYR